jgi:hypothetical protein
MKRRAIHFVYEQLPDTTYRHALFLRSHRRWGDFRHPRTFNEKVNWRILFDRRDSIAWTCDKLAMKEYAREVDLGDLRIPETLWVGEDLSELVSVGLTGDWVLKPNHASNRNVFLGSGAVTDPAPLMRAMDVAMAETQASVFREWAYLNATRALLVERRVPTEDPGEAPTDYKFLTFGGEVAAIQVHVDRHSNHAMAYYSPDWRKLGFAAHHGDAGTIPRPRDLDRMLAVARVLGKPFDFMRVDLYCEQGEIYFGELTPYPGGGLETFAPLQLDAMLGALWKLPPL